MRALFPRPCLPEDILYALIVMAKSQFIACAGYDVIEANFSPRVNWDNFTVLWKKEIKVIELLTICQIRSTLVFELFGKLREETILGYVICLIFYSSPQISFPALKHDQNDSIWVLLEKSFMERAYRREGCCWELDVVWSVRVHQGLTLLRTWAWH